jgi:PAB-dependent poly(A)-specific ribonuclease subunit 2
MPTEQRRVIQNLPAILNVNCGNFSEDDLQIWRAADPFFKFDVGPSIHAGSGSFKSFLPLYIRLIIDQKSQTLNVEEFNNLPSGDDTNNIYRLTSVICQIRKDNDVAHLVSFVSMADGNWYLYNDFLVRQVSDHEAVQFKSKWKSPAVLQFERIDIDHETIISRFQPPSTMDHRTFDEIMRVG